MHSVRVFAASLRAPCSSRAFASSARPALRAAPAPRTPVVARHVFRRGYSTEAPKEGGNSALWLTLGAVVAAGGGYWYYMQSTDATTLGKSAKQAGKAAVGFTPKQGDYQQVYNKVADLLDEAGDYDGEWPTYQETSQLIPTWCVQTGHMVLFSSDWLGTRAEPTTKARALVEGMFLEIRKSAAQTISERMMLQQLCYHAIRPRVTSRCQQRLEYRTWCVGGRKEGLPLD